MVDDYWWSCLINHNTWLFPTLTAVDFSFSCIFSLQPAEFSIWTREAGAGGLAIAVEGPSRAEISFDDRKDGSCGVSYIAQEPGRANAHRWLLTGVSLWLSLSYVLAPPLVSRWLRDLGEVQRPAHTRQPLPRACRCSSERRSPPHCYRPSGEAWGDTSTTSLPCLAKGLLRHSCIKMWRQEQKTSLGVMVRLVLVFWSNTDKCSFRFFILIIFIITN